MKNKFLKLKDKTISLSTDVAVKSKEKYDDYNSDENKEKRELVKIEKKEMKRLKEEKLGETVFFGLEKFRVNRSLKQVTIRKVTFNFDDILAVEVIEDDTSTYKSKGGRNAVVGGVLFGPIGLVAGAAGSKKTEAKDCSVLKVVVTVNNIHNPQIEFNYINKKTAKKDKEYIKKRAAAQKLNSFFTVIINSK